MDIQEMMKYFTFVIIRRLQEERIYTGIPNIRFVFHQETIKDLATIIMQNFQNGEIMINNGMIESREHLSINEMENVINHLRGNYHDYQKYQNSEYILDENEIFLVIKDTVSFFQNLTNIINELREIIGFNKDYEDSLLTSIWLRMGPGDIQNINGFLQREYHFLQKGYDLNSSRLKTFFNQHELHYDIQLNESCFETSYKIIFYLAHGDEYYYFPMIHYGINDENGKKVCYLYAMQDSKDLSKSSEIANSLQNIKKMWRNKYVKFSFPLALQFFIELLRENHIEEIKVPLLQVLNYPYHINLGNIMEMDFQRNYPPLKQEIIERCLKKSIKSPILIQYQNDKERMKNYVNKADTISKNKTERLLATFNVLNNQNNCLSILNDPFIEDEFLNVKIKRKV